jgi:ABC-2 type transport system ATP-binding protein
MSPETGVEKSQNIASASGLSKSFGSARTPALSAIDLAIKGGRITGLVGPDGSGKTTLLRLLAGLLSPTAGRSEVLGHDPARDVEALQLLIGYMPQRFGLYEDLTVRENLDLYADLRDVNGPEREKTFARLLSFTDLAPFQDRLAGKLSGGMKQKLGLACTLLGRPRLLLLDEPSVGVDPIARRELWRMVRDLVAEGIAVVWSTAYLDEASLCDYVLLLDRGKVLFAGAPRELDAHVDGRVFLLRGFDEPPRVALRKAREDPASLDGVIQGRSVRLVARPDARIDPTAHDIEGNPVLVAVAPRFEDGFIDLLGGAPPAASPLTAVMPSRLDLDRTGRDEVVVDAQALTKDFGDFRAASSISLAVRRGEVFGLLGPNGAGKSTTFKMLCGLLAPTSGTARVAGVDLRKSPSEARQRLGYMAQKFSLYGNLSVSQNLAFFAGAYGLDGAESQRTIAQMLAIFKLEEVTATSAGELSLGHKQRLALACALLHGPEVLFLDEPTSGVDPLMRREFWTHINGVVERGVTVLVTTHFMDEAEYCDRIALISQGHVVACGTPDDLKSRAASPSLREPTMEDAFISLVRGPR